MVLVVGFVEDSIFISSLIALDTGLDIASFTASHLSSEPLSSDCGTNVICNIKNIYYNINKM